MTVLDSSIVAKRGVIYGTGLNTTLPAVRNDETDTSYDLPGTDPDIVEESIDGTKTDEDVNYENDEYPNRMEILRDELLENDKIIVSEARYLDITDNIYAYLDWFLGKEIEIVGFVYKQPDLEEDQFVVARFGITCCVADASVFGILSTSGEMFEVEEDEWIRATGYLSKITLEDWDYPYLQITNIEKVEEPENPYIN